MKKLIRNQKYDFRVNYFADKNGHIWSESNQNYLAESLDKNGYHKVTLMTTDKPMGKGHRFSVHRLILSTFNPIEHMNEFTVDHIDGDIHNNQLSNLRWASMKDNLLNPNTMPNRRCYDQDGELNTSAKFTQESLQLMINDVNSGNFKRKEILNKYNICDETLRKILLKKTYQKELQNIEIKPLFIDDHARDTKGDKNGRAKLTENQVLEIIDLLLSKQYSGAAIARVYNVSSTTVNHIKNKRTWTYLTENITFD